MDRDVIDPTTTATIDSGQPEASDTEGHSVAYARFLGSRQSPSESERQRLAKLMVEDALPPLTKRFPKFRGSKGS